MGYVEQLTFLLFFKMAGELSKATCNRPNGIPQGKDKKGKTVDYDCSALAGSAENRLSERVRSRVQTRRQ
jgi:hypothetical protein